MIIIKQTGEFSRWIRKLKDTEARARINLRIRRFQVTENAGDTKPLGDGVFEMRVDYGPGYRIYYSIQGDKIILLLIGGDKSSQNKDIEKAKKLKLKYVG